MLELTNFRAMDEMSRGTTNGASQDLEDAIGNPEIELEAKSIVQDVTRNLAGVLSPGQPRRAFDIAY